MLSNEVAIKVDGISKAYQMYHSPSARFFQFFTKKIRHEEFKALDDVSFEVKKGDTVGIVGKNGSGKSTLLQIIAGTVAPSTGDVQVNGKVVALLELGSGFNPEFTGKENIYLNAAMFGINRDALQEKIKEIEDFADIGDHLEQPVKTYSSGMFARLAFAVAINMDPDILIIDEILAVGDMAFQAKCVSKMRQLKDQGVTLLFVSHSVDSIKSMCNSAILMQKGKLINVGTSERITNQYLAMIREELNNVAGTDSDDDSNDNYAATSKSDFKYGKGEVSFEAVETLDYVGNPIKAVEFGQNIILDCKIKSKIKTDNVNISFLVRDITGIDLFGTTMFDEKIDLFDMEKEEVKRVSFNFPVLLRQGSYSISVALNRVTDKNYSDVYLYEQIDGVVAFEVVRKLDRPVHYKIHVPVEIKVRGDSNGK
ncbi:Vitamin B12 import ATP-binding protein BtuD [Paenibacillus plantiphilus]|uniref:Vitamin B12 import ATP-binding protein BtuD n=1 Tax=Paenibacillus plantiphilus TaxID=2905650 RepID=A0ABM9BTN0_9BACL|nr:ABC transporter ATP-binding protein [Paenibacillus plantiphilus]CAH1193351.1 Vitamin B12 import ATP-binding protein BtuD [Paenibacillus plantiphilus]